MHDDLPKAKCAPVRVQLCAVGVKRRPRAESRCAYCRFPQKSCACSTIERLKIGTSLVLVMHTRETPRGIATGPLAVAALQNSTLVTYGKRDEELSLEHLHEQGRRIVVLTSNGEGSELNETFVQNDPRPITLVVPDGNSRQVNRATKRILGLQAAEKVHLPATSSLLPSSTLDNIAAALGQFESSGVQAHLLGTSARLRELRAANELRPIGGVLERADCSSPRRGSHAPALPILYEDERLIAVNKSAGQLVHRGWGDDAAPVLQLLRDQIGRRVYPLHRLDRATSGVLLFSLDAEMARSMQVLFSTCQVEKKYIALCRGADLKTHTLHHPLAKNKGEEKRPASTSFRQLGSVERYRLVEASPQTGRTHQIRRHLKHLSRPIIGDVRYGKGEHNRLFRERFGFHRLALHCAHMSFRHPGTGAALCIEAPLESEFERLLQELGLTWNGRL